MARSKGGTGAASAAPIAISKNAGLAEIDRAEQAAYAAIDAVQDPDAAEDLLCQVKVAEHAIRIAKVSADREQRWAGLRLRAERRYGELLGPPMSRRETGGVTGRNTSGADRAAQSRARKVAAVPEVEFEAYLADTPKPTHAGLVRDRKTKAAAPTQQNGKPNVSPAEAADRLRQRVRYVQDANASARPRWTLEDVQHLDLVMKHLLKRRPKYAGKRLRELAPKRGVGPKPRLADLQYRMMQLTQILESVDVADYDLSDPEEVEEFHDDLVELQLWMERSISLASARLDDAALERKIRKLRDTSGRPEPEQQTARALADKLERRRRESRLNS